MNRLILYLDTEYQGTTYLSLQILAVFPGGEIEILCINDGLKLSSDTIDTIERYCIESNINLLWTPFEDGVNTLENVMNSVFSKTSDLWGVVTEDGFWNPNQCELKIFYSPRDLEPCFTWDSLEKLYRKGYTTLVKGYPRIVGIGRQRALKGITPPIQRNHPHFKNKLSPTIHDLSGWTNESLKSLGQALGLSVVDKGLMDPYKSIMLNGLKEHPNEFIRYAMGDVRLLRDIDKSFPVVIDQVCDKLGIDRLREVPHTIGSLVRDLLRGWIHSQGDARYKVSLYKLGILDPHQKPEKLEAARVALEESRGPAPVWEDLLSRLESARWEYLTYSQASPSYLLEAPYSAAFGGIVIGGRCVNENPWELTAEYVADVDLKGAYGSSIRDLFYPIGLPHITGYTSNERNPTLGRVLDRERLLSDNPTYVTGMYHIVVSGTLSFDQDLVYSYNTTQTRLNNRSNRTGDSEPDEGNIPGDAILARNEILNGVLTHDTLKILKSVSTDKEWSEIRKLEVISIVGYRVVDECPTLDSWVDEVIGCKGVYTGSDNGSRTIKDTRTRKWYRLSLESYIGRLVDWRNECKSLGASDPNMKALSNVLKLVINSTYGVLASVYFQESNSVIANQITSHCRCEVWMLAKSLGLRQTITDGGLYEPWRVPNLLTPSKLPGLHRLANQSRDWSNWENGAGHNSIVGDDWKTRLDTLSSSEHEVISKELQVIASELDIEATKHHLQFWSYYGIKPTAILEHKPENTGLRAAYLMKAHYAIKRIDGSVRYKIRGCDNHSPDSGLKRSPIYDLFDELLSGGDIFPEDLTYHHHELVGVNDWRNRVLSKDPQNKEWCESYRPGQDHVTERVFRWNDHYFPVGTVKEYLKRVNRPKEKDGHPIEWYEADRQLGIRGVHRRIVDSQ